MDKPNLYTPNELSAFQLFTDFLNNLTEHLQENKLSVPKSLQLYHRLVSSVKFNQDGVFQRHITTLRNFCISNRQTFPNHTFSTQQLQFSERIFVDFPQLFNLLDGDTTATVWEYLFNLSRLLDPNSIVDVEVPKGDAGLDLSQLTNNLDIGQLAGMLGGMGGGMGGANPMMGMLGTMMNPETMGDIMSTFNDEIESGNINLDELKTQVGDMMKQFEPIMSKLQSKLNLDDFQPNIN